MTSQLRITNTDFAISENDSKVVISNLIELRDDVWDTMSKNTRKAYQLDFNQYVLYCREKSIPALASDWRQTKESCKAYFENMMQSNLSHHSIKRKLASIRFFIGVCELPDPWKHSKLFTKFIAGQLRQKPAAQHQAPPLKLDSISEINKSLNFDNLLELRDAAIINVAIDTLFRASNIIAVDISHIDFKAKTIYAPRSKTDQEGEGFYAYISDETIAILKMWLTKAAITSGYVFRKLSPKHTVQGENLQYEGLLKRFAKIGLILKQESTLTCHSTRVGGVLTMLENDIPLADIMLSGNWKSQAMPIRYGQQYVASKTGMAKVRK